MARDFVAACLLTALVGYLIGINRLTVTIRTCPATVGTGEATATCAEGWSYAIPVDDVQWTDATGGLHEGGRPDCLPSQPQQLARLTFGSVDVTVNQSSWPAVVWVSRQ